MRSTFYRKYLGRRTWLALPLATLSISLVLATPYASADVKERTLRVSYATAKDSALGYGVDKFAELVKQKTAGKITVKGYSDGQLGSEVQSISSTAGGIIEMNLSSTATAANTLKEFAVFDLPFLFTEEKEAYAVLDGAVGTHLIEKFTEKGLVGLCYWEAGFRNITNNKRSINKVEDIGGLKIRTFQNPTYIESLNSLGANAIPMPYTEVYTALETKAIDGQEGPYSVVYTNKFHEVQKYMSATKHAYGVVLLMTGKKLWDQMSSEEKKILKDSCAEARDYERQLSREMNSKAVTQLKAAGMVLNDIDPAERARMIARAKPVIDKYTKVAGEDLVKRTYAELEKIRQK